MIKNQIFLTVFKCRNKGCYWKNYEVHDDWEIYEKTERYIDCNVCQRRCLNDENCGAVECEFDNKKVQYCSWWKVGKCATEEEWNFNNASFFTCYKQ